MAKVKTTRKARFAAALALTGQTLRGYAASRGYSRFHLGEVVAGRRKTPALLAEVERFIEQVERKAASLNEKRTAA